MISATVKSTKRMNVVDTTLKQQKAIRRRQTPSDVRPLPKFAMTSSPGYVGYVVRTLPNLSNRRGITFPAIARFRIRTVGTCLAAIAAARIGVLILFSIQIAGTALFAGSAVSRDGAVEI